MAEAGFVKTADAEKAKRTPLGVTTKASSARIFAAEYFAEEVRRELYERYGEKKLYEGGLSVRTSLDPKLQVLARKAFTDGIMPVMPPTAARSAICVELAGNSRD